MGVGGNERSKFDGLWDDNIVLATRELWCDTPISLRLILLPLLYSAERVSANLLFGTGVLVGAGLVVFSEAINSFIHGSSGAGSSWTWNLRLLVAFSSRSSALPLSGSSINAFSSCSSTLPLSGISLIPQRLFSSISRKYKALRPCRGSGGAVDSSSASSCSQQRADRLFRKTQVMTRALSKKKVIIPAVIPAMLWRLNLFDDFAEEMATMFF